MDEEVSNTTVLDPYTSGPRQSPSELECAIRTRRAKTITNSLSHQKHRHERWTVYRLSDWPRSLGSMAFERMSMNPASFHGISHLEFTHQVDTSGRFLTIDYSPRTPDDIEDVSWWVISSSAGTVLSISSPVISSSVVLFTEAADSASALVTMVMVHEFSVEYWWWKDWRGDGCTLQELRREQRVPCNTD